VLEEQGEDDSTSWKFFLVGSGWGAGPLGRVHGEVRRDARKETGEPASIERFGTPTRLAVGSGGVARGRPRGPTQLWICGTCVLRR
jgi:hypothetical protein